VDTCQEELLQPQSWDHALIGPRATCNADETALEAKRGADEEPVSIQHQHPLTASAVAGPETISMEHRTVPVAASRQLQSTASALAAPGATSEQNARVMEILEQMSATEAAPERSTEEDDTPEREKESESKSRKVQLTERVVAIWTASVERGTVLENQRIAELKCPSSTRMTRKVDAHARPVHGRRLAGTWAATESHVGWSSSRHALARARSPK
jgi:hypothetical protein